MFNRTLLAVGGDSHHHTHVEMVDPSVEKAARFLDETVKEAHKRVVSAMLIDVPAIGVQVVRYEAEISHSDGQRHHRIAFTLNGRQFDVGVSHDEFDDTQKIVGIVIDHIAKAIAARVISMDPTRRIIKGRW